MRCGNSFAMALESHAAVMQSFLGSDILAKTLHVKASQS
jgi:hypothetical protein